MKGKARQDIRSESLRTLRPYTPMSRLKLLSHASFSCSWTAWPAAPSCFPNWGNRFERPLPLRIPPWGVYLSTKKAFDFLRWSRPFLLFIYYVSKHRNCVLKSTFPDCKHPAFSTHTHVQGLGDGALSIWQSFSYKRHEWVNLGKGITSLILSTPRMHCK